MIMSEITINLELDNITSTNTFYTTMTISRLTLINTIFSRYSFFYFTILSFLICLLYLTLQY